MKKLLFIIFLIPYLLFGAEFPKNLALYFESELHSDMFLNPMRSKGFLVADSSGRIRWQIQEPQKSMALFDGKRFSIYEYQDKTWRKLNTPVPSNVSDTFGTIAMLVRGDLPKSWKEEYSSDKKTRTVFPNSDKLGLEKIEIVLAGKFPTQIKMYLLGGDIRILKILSIKVNVDSLESAFSEKAINFLEFIP